MQNAKWKVYVMRIAVSCQQSEEVVRSLSSLFASANRDDRLRNAFILLFILHKIICKGFYLYNIKSSSNQAKLQYTLKYQVFKSIFINSNPKGKLLCKCFYLYISKRKTTTVNQIFKLSFVHFADTKNNDKILLR